MNAASTPNTCPRCGTPIPADAPQGLCPHCVLAGAAADTESGTAVAALSSVANPHRLEAPPLDRVAAAFPQLEVIELIGVGGMGAVFKARQPKLDRFVALKILPEALAANSTFVERFNREARLLARLNHPSIVAVYDFGQAGGFCYLLMEYVDGVNLRQAMRAGRFSPVEALAVVPKICEALQFAHDQGALHRDIKPENILLDSRGRVKIADFGIAKLVGDPGRDPTLTAAGAALGTPAYMAPEQIEKPSDVDHRADIYSLGVVFYEMLTGELPLGRFAPPSAKVSLDERIDEIVLRALAKERELRQQSATQVRTEVEDVATRLKTEAQRASESTSPAELPPLWRTKPELKPALLLLLVVSLGVQVYKEIANARWLFVPLTNGWPSVLCALLGAVGLVALGLAIWRRRTLLFSSLNLPAGLKDLHPGATTDYWLRVALLGLLACLGFDLAKLVWLHSGFIGDLLSQGGYWAVTDLLLQLLFLVALPVLAVRRELRRTRHLPAPAPVPAWMPRFAVLLVLLMITSSVAELGGRGGRWITVLGIGDLSLLTAIALWTRSRVCRAAALPINAWFLFSGLSQAGGVLVQAARGQLVPADAPGSIPFFAVLANYPGLVVLLQFLGSLASAAALIALLVPSARAAFGLPPRAGARETPANPAGGGSAPVSESGRSDALTATALVIVAMFTGLWLGGLMIYGLRLPGGVNVAFAAALVIASPVAGLQALKRLRRWRSRGEPDARAWLKAAAWIGFLVALPTVGFGLFFLHAMLSETGGWHPAFDEAVLVPLTWLGSLLLPPAAVVLWRASSPPAPVPS